MDNVAVVTEEAAFREDLNRLNEVLVSELRKFAAPEVLSGNLFYEHLQKDFSAAPLTPRFEGKRRRLMEIAQHGSVFFEVGVNGGHSMLLVKSANPKLRCVGVDICKQLHPAWGRVDLYVPAAMRWLRQRFPNQMRFIVGDSQIELPRYALSDERLPIDILHLDGAKHTYFQDFVNIRPSLKRGAIVVLDDSHTPVVQKCIRDLLAIGAAEVHPDFPTNPGSGDLHMVMRVL
ncbi:class I SAM-dependent methyltransferase [Aurantimonas sp. VKM B-3413]|uniref:class I SAM-dependent methyltransferase n=1 Tax=Aurantimonas sp. VKM B-3413 TaxID=2779401 RepID=UPI001E3E95DF|nr:class I SAM-dependent methyltransferase [Aurantimonas sp. VKM B-3413]MCB8836480.1 class I SAM-dependent methyltransferase [Aurantimonas sp. VKM B-3413]